MAKMNFYTSNGWDGSNYDSKLSTKEIAAKVREFAKKNFPNFKFSVTSRWSMYADSLYIVLKSGPCVPFVEGSKLANRGRFETMSSVKDWEKDGLTHEVFAALDGVTSYSSSFRYDDSDGMQDYFDTNFYLKIEIDDDYKVIEPKAKKQTTKKQEEPETVEASAGVDGLEIVDYSEKAIAVFGETNEIKDHLKELGGKFNPALKYNGEKRAGWIFSKKKAEKVRALLALSDRIDENDTIIEGDYISFKTNNFAESKIYTGVVEYKEQLGYVLFADGVQYELKKILDVKKIESDLLIIPDYKKYGIYEYESVCDEMDGFKLGEVVFDQCGEIGVILAFYDQGEVRLNSNGVCNVANLQKCPKEIAEKELKYMDVLQPDNKLEAQTSSIVPKDFDEKVSQEDFVTFLNDVDYSKLPDGVTFEIK